LSSAIGGRRGGFDFRTGWACRSCHAAPRRASEWLTSIADAVSGRTNLVREANVAGEIPMWPTQRRKAGVC
jgi:hypothetical protein